MNSNFIGQAAWALLGVLGLITIVDLGFGPIVICPQCGGWIKTLLGVVLVAVSAAAFFTNRKTTAMW
jgi:hypothetical protein